MSALKPCPFCGDEAKIFGYPRDGGCYVGCANPECMAVIGECYDRFGENDHYFADADEAMEHWNRRHVPSA